MEGPLGKVSRAKRSVNKKLDALLKSAELDSCCLAADAPWLSSSLAVREQNGDVLHVRHGLYARASYWAALNQVERHLHIARALARKHPNWIFCRMTAALALGLSVTYARHSFEEVPIEIAVPSNTHCGLRHGVRLLPHEAGGTLWQASGLLVTRPARTVFDCVRSLPFDESLAMADSALHLRLMREDELATLVEDAGPARGIRNARRVLAHMDGRSESGGESMVRARMIELGYVVPELQVEFPNPLAPGRAYRADMLVRCGERLVVVELDGKCKYEEPEMLGGRTTLGVLLDERRREALLTSHGVEVMRLRYEDVMDEARFVRMMDAYRIPRATR